MNNSMKPALLSIAIISLAACSSNKAEQPKLDYQSTTGKVVSLEVPPDLTNPNQGNLYQIPAGTGAIRASQIKRNQTVQQAADSDVLKDIKGVHIERDGSQRWLVIDGKTAAEIWPLLKVFWQENGFEIASEDPAIGQMETAWAENRAKIPQDMLRRLFEKVGIGGIYSTSERDKFIIRIEKGNNNTLDVFFAHKGMQEIYTDKKQDVTMWQPRPNDPNLEAAFLARFMQYLGLDQQQVEQELSKTAQANRSGNDLAYLDGNSIIVSGDYNRNWRRTALALDRIGLTVMGQNMQSHAFLVQPAPQEGKAVRDAKNKPGLFKRLLGLGQTQAAPEPAAPEIIVLVEPINEGARISLRNRDGSVYNGKEASTWLGRLHTELR